MSGLDMDPNKARKDMERIVLLYTSMAPVQTMLLKRVLLPNRLEFLRSQLPSMSHLSSQV